MFSSPRHFYFVYDTQGRMLNGRLSIGQYERISFNAWMLQNHQSINQNVLQVFSKLPAIPYEAPNARINTISNSLALADLYRRAATYTGRPENEIRIIKHTMHYDADAQVIESLAADTIYAP